MADVRSMEQVLAGSVARPRFRTLLLGLFAAIALVLALVGIYGVLSYTVTQRRLEIAIRMALGAERGEVLRLIAGRGLALAAAGIALGLGAALAAGRLVESLLFEVDAGEPAALAVVCLLMLATATAASCLPALRAARTDPNRALRESG